jgi:hypothetical protein
MKVIVKFLGIMILGIIIMTACKGPHIVEPQPIGLPTLTIEPNKSSMIEVGEVVAIKVWFKGPSNGKISKLSAEVDMFLGTGFMNWNIFNGNTSADTALFVDQGTKMIYYKMQKNPIDIRITIIDQYNQKNTKLVALRGK